MKKENKSVMLSVRISQELYLKLYEKYDRTIFESDFWKSRWPTFSDYIRFLLYFPFQD